MIRQFQYKTLKLWKIVLLIIKIDIENIETSKEMKSQFLIQYYWNFDLFIFSFFFGSDSVMESDSSFESSFGELLASAAGSIGLDDFDFIDSKMHWNEGLPC